MKPSKSTRRTRADINLLSVEEVQAELVAAGLRPIEFVRVADEDCYWRNKIEPWQRYDFAEYAPRASDPFILDHFTRFPQDDLPTQWRKQLFESDLTTYVEGLTRQQLMAQLKVVTVDEQFDRTPEPGWTVENYKEELRARIRELEAVKPKTKHRRKST